METDQSLKKTDKQFLSLVPIPEEIPEEEMLPGLSKLVREYLELSTQSKLSDAETKRLIEISALAEYDDELNDWLMKIDENIELVLMVQQLQQKLFSLEDFILEVKCTSPSEMTLEKFMQLAQKVKISDEIIKKHIRFKDDERQLTKIFYTSSISIFTGTWKPGQKCSPHCHNNSLTAIHVLKGELTHYECKNIYPNSNQYRRIKTDKIQEGQWIGVDISQMHELVNESHENLITLHFRYFPSPVESESEEHNCSTQNSKSHK